MSIDVDKLTVGELREITRLTRSTTKAKETPLPFKPGDAIVIRTVTMIDVGRVVSIGRDFIVLEDGGWIADTGRFSEMLATGKINEFERAKTPWFLVGRGAICDVFPWAHSIPQATI